VVSPRISLLTATSFTLALATGAASLSERTKAWTPSSPPTVVMPISVTMNHCVAMSRQYSWLEFLTLAVIT
jgi:hypothetical protein